MTKSLIQLPEIIFTLIQTFLSYDDYHYFLNTSKLHFSHLKRRTIVFQLTERRSEQYMKDKEFQELLLSKVEDGWKQIRINKLIIHYTSSYDANVPHDSSYFDFQLEKLSYEERGIVKTLPPVSPKKKELKLFKFLKLQDVTTLSHLSKLQISYSVYFEDISPIKNVPDLTFYSCSALSDLSVLRGDKNKVINLILCGKLTDIHSLSRFRRVTVSHCDSLVDVSPLRGVYDVRIVFCRKVKDISGLGGHHRLEISLCSYSLIGYTCLVGVAEVRLHGCDISDLSILRYAKSIELQGCNEITDFCPISNVYNLSIQEMSINEKDLQNLSNHKLHIDLAKSRNITSVFPNTKHLALFQPSTPLIRILKEYDGSYFQCLQSITIDSTMHLNAIKGFEDIATVRLINMWALTDISGLGRNRYVELNNCNQIKDVRSLANVSVVRIEKCSGIVDYSVLANVPRLKIIEEPTLDWKF